MSLWDLWRSADDAATMAVQMELSIDLMPFKKYNNQGSGIQMSRTIVLQKVISWNQLIKIEKHNADTESSNTCATLALT